MSDLYVPCPKCRGEGLVLAITQIGDGWRPTRSAHFPCDLCHQTGEADAERAAEFVGDQSHAEAE